MATRTQTSRVEITDYTDYVSYLVDLIEYKREVSGFSYRVFCRKSGFKSPSYLKWVVDGVRPISLKSVYKYITGLSLDKREAQYFTLMVNYKAATDQQTKRFYYEQMLKWRQHRSGNMTKDAYEYLSHWYYVAIRELIGSPEFTDDPRWIRDYLDANLTVAEIKNGLEVLERLQLITCNGKGHWEQTSKDLQTEHEVNSLAAFNYHSEMMELAQNVLTNHKGSQRDFQSLVAMIDDEAYAELLSKIRIFQEDLVEYLQQQEKVTSNRRARKKLYALNTQLLPLTTSPKKEGV
jgi:uncharacterized protein (TIGR02147 family)